MDAWVYLTDEASGYSYYANTKTQQTSWTAPPELGGGDAEEATPYLKLDNGWYQYKDDRTGRLYNYNQSTQATEWAAPPEAGADDDYVSDDDIRSASPSHKDEAGDDEDDVDGAEEDVFVRQTCSAASAPVRRLSEASVRAEPEADPEEEEEEKRRQEEQKRKAKRLRILGEFLSTEQTYVQAVQTLEKVYIDPLRMVADAPKGALFSHADLDAVFLNISVISKVNQKFLEELEAEHKNWPEVLYGPIISEAAKKFKGCYTRYVNNYDEAEKHMLKLKGSDKEKHRYLEVCKTHPDAHGLDIRSFLIQPVQRVPRYRMLLEDLLKVTEEGHPDEAPLRDALEKVKEVAKHINEDKRKAEELETLNAMVLRFTSDSGMDKELVRYDRNFLREGVLTKARLQRRQKRHCFLFNDLLLYAVSTAKGFQVKGKISLDLRARIEMLPDTETMCNAFAVIEKGGKGYTWLTDSPEETREWFEAIEGAIRSNRPKRTNLGGPSILDNVQSKAIEARVAKVCAGTVLMKYNQRDGKSGPRWVKIDAANKISWGDTRTKEPKSSMKLGDAIALLHGAKSSAFFKQQHAKKDQDWLCFSLVFKGRGTLDFAATNADALLDWYLARRGMGKRAALWRR